MARTAVTNRLAVRDAGTCLYFDGSNDKVQRDALTIGTLFTISFWFYPNDITLGQTIFNNIESSSSRIAISIASGTLKVGFYNGSSYVGSKSYVIPRPRRWYHLVYTFDGTTSQLFINGVKPTTSTLSPISAATVTFIFGSNLASFFNGYMDKVLVYKKVLNNNEINDLYYINIVPQEPTDYLLARYELNEATGTIAYDSSGNGNNGAITGAIYSTSVNFSNRTSNVTSRTVVNSRTTV